MSTAFLTDAERESACWMKIKERYQRRLATLRLQMDGDLDPIKTTKIRGRIAECKLILGLETDAMPLFDANENFKD